MDERARVGDTSACGGEGGGGLRAANVLYRRWGCVRGCVRTINAGAGAGAANLDRHALRKLGAEPVSPSRAHEDGRDVEGARVGLTSLGGRHVEECVGHVVAHDGE